MVDELKICSRCKEPKSLEDYSVDRGKYLRSECKACKNESVKNRFKTLDGYFQRVYSHQITTSRTKGYDMLNYTKQELKDWMLAQPIFNILFEKWKESGYISELRPSCDRLVDYKSYTLDNLQIMTWGENRAKGHLDRKNGVNNKKNCAVVGLSVNDNKEISFYSMAEAERKMGISHADISECCSGKRKTSGGYYWRKEACFG